jgi:hypothetical protein
MNSITKHVGFDVLKDRITVSVASSGIAPARFRERYRIPREMSESCSSVSVSLRNYTYAMRRELWVLAYTLSKNVRH